MILICICVDLVLIYIKIYLCKWTGHWSAYESGCPLVARGRLHALPCIIDNVHIAQDVLFACLLLELQCTSQVHALPCTIDNVHNMYYTLRGCFACCFLNCNVHYRKSDRLSDWAARSVQLFAQQTDCNKQSDARWGSVLSVKRIGHHAYQPKKNVSLNQTNRCWDDFPVPCQIFIELPQCLSTQQTTSDLGSNAINLSP